MVSLFTRKLNGLWRIETLTVKHGLPSNQVNDVAQLGDEIWVATDHGIARFREKPAPVPMPSPQLERFRVNNRDTFFAENTRLAQPQHITQYLGIFLDDSVGNTRLSLSLLPTRKI